MSLVPDIKRMAGAFVAGKIAETHPIAGFTTLVLVGFKIAAQVLLDQAVHLFRGIVLAAVNTDLDAVTRIITAGIIDNLAG